MFEFYQNSVSVESSENFGKTKNRDAITKSKLKIGRHLPRVQDPSVEWSSIRRTKRHRFIHDTMWRLITILNCYSDKLKISFSRRLDDAIYVNFFYSMTIFPLLVRFYGKATYSRGEFSLKRVSFCVTDSLWEIISSLFFFLVTLLYAQTWCSKKCEIKCVRYLIFHLVLLN